ncbi:YncE family protein [Nocardioides sp.]|uniref:YncE family protein n=1 Tax=Nocardioides sp. TaxID=35761 RepID=UPI0027213D23|nr:serine/threonine protein kinase [Nocardioides sp.]MDO9457872.1 serine/threonine protein kinase [Nocardioides sp.]
MGSRMRVVGAIVAGALAASGALTSPVAEADSERAPAAAVDPPAERAQQKRKPVGASRATRPVVFVGNNWEGTATLVGPRSFKKLGVIDVVPDYAERMQEIATNPYRLAYFLAIRALIGEGNDQFVDDMYSSNDVRLVVISRPSFADVVAISLRSKKIVWRFQVAGVRSDHMAVSPDGKRVVVSASTGNVVHVLRIADGKEVGRFASGGSPHESTFIDGGRRILHASIGTVYSPLDEPAIPDPLEGDRVLQIVNARTLEIERRYNLRKALDARGLKDVSISVRPMTLSPDEKKFYFQLSFFHGFVELDRRSGKITRVVRLPNLVPDTPRPAYLLDSAHHGIAANPTGSRICVAGTMSDYATLVDTRTWKHTRLIRGGLKPYWVTPSADGRFCYISWSGSDTVSRISYRTARIRSTVRVGDHPQRIRNGFVRKDFLAGIGFHPSSAPRRTSAATAWERPAG